jgi:hypothetical protein
MTGKLFSIESGFRVGCHATKTHHVCASFH